MLTCIPQSVFSWSFDVEGAAGGPAALTFNFFTEQGTIVYGNEEYEVKKYGWMSGQWGVERRGQSYARALKPNPLTRKFEVQEGDKQFLLRATPLTRCYDILWKDSVIGTIAPAHFLTRRATIDCRSELSEQGQLFCFWLAALTWRRAARSNSN